MEMNVAGAIALIGFGAVEGWAFATTGMLDPNAVHTQMSFDSWIVMKLFTAAVGSSMLCQSLMSTYDNDKFQQSRGYSSKALSSTSVAVGSLILGTGMYLCGSGPTIVPGQVAAQVVSGPAILAGCFAGGLAFALTESMLPKNVGPPVLPLDQKYAGGSYPTIAVPLGLALLGASVGFEKLFPHVADVKSAGISGSLLPTVAGIILGVNQLPLRFIAQRGQGGSTPVMSLIGTLSGGIVGKKYQMKSLKDWFQTLYVYAGTALGAYIAIRNLRGSNFTSPIGFSNVVSFLGGFLMLYGARVADGCTCGHGISGFSELSPVSMLGAACIFAGGIGAATVSSLLQKL